MYTNVYILIGAYLGGWLALVLFIFCVYRIYRYYQRKKKNKIQQLITFFEMSENPSQQPFSPPHHWGSDDAAPVVPPRSPVFIQECQQKQLSDEFMQRYLSTLHKAYFSSLLDQCYCSICLPRLPSHRSHAGYTSTLPQNWYRIGLKVDKALAEGQNIYTEWSTSYHGTSIDRAISIIQNRQLLIPGDIANNNKRVGIVHGTRTPYFYTTPCIKYASLETYSRSVIFTSSITGKSYKVKIVIQLRQKPGTFRVQRGTIRCFYPPNPPVCNIIKHEQLEWYSNTRSSTVPYGLLIKFEHIPLANLSRTTISSQQSYPSSRRSTTTDTEFAIKSSSFSFYL